MYKYICEEKSSNNQNSDHFWAKKNEKGESSNILVIKRRGKNNLESEKAKVET